MAKTKKQEETALAVQVPSWAQELALSARDEVAQITQGASRISFKGGNITIGGQVMKDKKISVIILGMMFQKVYYAEEFDADRPTSPTCYAFSKTDHDPKLAPHPQAAEKQSDSCVGCKWNQFRTKGKGKACRDGWRIAVVHGGVTVADLPKAEVYTAVISPTSLKYLANYIQSLRQSNLDHWFVQTQLSLEPVGGAFGQRFELLGVVSRELATALKQHIQPAMELLATPYPTVGTEGEEAKPKGRTRGRDKF